MSNVKNKMDIDSSFRDIILVDETGAIRYFNIGDLDFFDLKPEDLLGKRIPQLYDNLSDETSTLMRAVRFGEEYLGCVQELITKGGKRVRQKSDTLCVKDGERVVGAIEFAFYNEGKDILSIHAPAAPLRDLSQISLDDIIGESPRITEVKKKAAKVIDLQSPILITGPTGTGKEMLARAIHNSSKRRQKAFVYINCGALPENLLESILFGTKKGSFTDAMEKEGLFQLADKGTLFLDEINSMPLGLQGKLLKAIEDKCIRPIGGEEEIYLDVRIIASSNLGVSQLLNGSSLRKDLYFRLSVIQFELPALKDRDEDVLLIADYYIAHFNRILGRRLSGVCGELRDLFLRHSWPGNVRELRNTLESACYGADGSSITVGDVQERLLTAAGESQPTESMQESQLIWEQYTGSGLSLKAYLAQLERRRIQEALAQTGGDTGQTARLLGISPQLLRQKKQNLNLEK